MKKTMPSLQALLSLSLSLALQACARAFFIPFPILAPATQAIKVIESLYSKASSAVYLNGSIGEWFRTTVGLRRGCLLSPTFFNIFLEIIMTDAREQHERTGSIGGRTITNLCFADDIDGLAGKEQQLAELVESLDKTSAAFGMEISAEKTKQMTNNSNGVSTDCRVRGEKLEAVRKFKYLGSVVSDE